MQHFYSWIRLILNFDVLRTATAFFLIGTMAKRIKLEQKDVLDLPDEIIEDKIMVFLSIQDLNNLIEVGNQRLENCSQRVIKKRPCSKYHYQ